MRRSVRVGLGSLCAAVGLLGSGTAATAATQAGTDAVCTVEATIIFSPPTKLTGGAGTNTSENGTITCVGRVNGYRVTGPGPYEFWDIYGLAPNGQSCAFDTGYGSNTYTIPTEGGPVRVSEPANFFGAAAGTFFTPSYNGTFQIVPDNGSTCVTTPVVTGTILMQGALFRA